MAGIAVGGAIVGVVVIGLLAWFCYFRHRRSRGINTSQLNTQKSDSVEMMRSAWSKAELPSERAQQPDSYEHAQSLQWIELNSEREPAELKSGYLPSELCGQNKVVTKAAG